MKRFIKEVKVTPERARELEKNYTLEYVSINADGTATYNMYEKDKTDEADTNNRA